MSYDKKLEELFIELPEITRIGGFSAPAVVSDKFLFTSSFIPIAEGRLMERGRVGIEVPIDRAKLAAKQASLWALSSIRNACGGTLNKISKILVVDIDVASNFDFADHEKISDSACEMLISIFGSANRPAKRIRGVSSLPQGAAIQVSLVTELK